MLRSSGRRAPPPSDAEEEPAKPRHRNGPTASKACASLGLALVVALGERDSTANRNAPSGAILSAIASGHASGTTRCASMTMYSAPAAAATTIGRVA